MPFSHQKLVQDGRTDRRTDGQNRNVAYSDGCIINYILALVLFFGLTMYKFAFNRD